MRGFPVFLDFETARPLINGGTVLAAAKARLLLSRAQMVTVTAVALDDAFAAMVAAGQIEHIARPAAESDLAGRILVISATGDDREDARVSDLARARGIPTNVPDRPHLSTFALGAIVDRGTVTVAIGTDGAAPVLATRLRAKLEQELHPRVGRLADMAREYREAIGAKLPQGARRRAFWETIFGGAPAQAILDGDEATGRALIERELDGVEDQNVLAGKPGRVLLVGAGPGDPDLLTLKAVRALKSADVILHDYLASAGVLDHARREAEIVCVGKAKGRHSRSQAEINELILHYARAGKTVVRLKGGDPFMFGRGIEEIEAVRVAGIAVEVVPGITAAMAASASLQIPLTHRDLARSVTFLSGHKAGDGSAQFDQVDFRAMAQSRATLAVYMAVSTSGALAKMLLASGWSPATPVIAVEQASHASERRVATTLDVLAATPERLGLKSAAVLIVGEVASLDASGAVTHIAAETQARAERDLSNV
jgi:uroporphyrin-III C-methyltransferase / precorrin-2 dehydrogenase / sirohydrochlorin ferrochelatase